MKYHFLSKHPAYQALFLFVAIGVLFDALMFLSHLALYSGLTPWEFHLFPLAALLMTGLSADVSEESVSYKMFGITVKRSQWTHVQWFPEGRKLLRAVATPPDNKKAVILPLLMKNKEGL
jgi:hypothetical protein